MILCNLLIIQASLGLAMIVIVMFGKLVMSFDKNNAIENKDTNCKHYFNQDEVMNLKIDPKCVKCNQLLSKCN